MVNQKLILIVGLITLLFAITSCGIMPPSEPEVPDEPNNIEEDISNNELDDDLLDDELDEFENPEFECEGLNQEMCEIENGEGQRERFCENGKWSEWSTCKIISCNEGYYEDSGDCILQTNIVYHVDVLNGDDMNDGSENAPFKTFEKVMSVLSEGDVALFYDGFYGNVTVGIKDPNDCDAWDKKCPKNEFTDWVTIKAAPNNNPVFGRIQIGDTTCRFREFGCGGWEHNDGEGVANIYMIFDGLEITDGFRVLGSRNVQLKNSLVKLPGPWIGSSTIIERAAIRIKFGSDILLKGNDITETGHGIGLYEYSRRIKIIDNEIHNIAHDGILVMSAQDVLVEGNRIHTLDDGARDSDGVSWNRHCDGLHLYPVVYREGADWYHVKNITVRGNVIYNVESQGMMFNSKAKDGTIEFHDIIIENNIFGPTPGGPMINAATRFNGFTVRHNSFIQFEGEFEGRYRNFTVSKAHVIMPRPSTLERVRIYNNIFYTAELSSRKNYERFESNTFYSGSVSVPVDRNTIILEESPFKNPELLDGILKDNSELIDAGSALNHALTGYDEIRLQKDIYGNLRDNRPDMGAVEKQGRNPPLQALPLPEPENPTLFLEDFGNGYLHRKDPFLNTHNRTGLTWYNLPGFQNYILRREGGNVNRMSPACETFENRFIISNETFKNFEFEYTTRSSHRLGDEGSVFLFQDLDNYYFFDTTGGKLIRRLNGDETILIENNKMHMSSYSLTKVNIKVTQTSNKINIKLYYEDELVGEHTDTKTNSIQTFSNGGNIGFTSLHGKAATDNPHWCYRATIGYVSVKLLS